MDVRSPLPAFSIPAFKAYFLPVTTRGNFLIFFFHFPEPQIISSPAIGVNKPLMKLILDRFTLLEADSLLDIMDPLKLNRIRK